MKKKIIIIILITAASLISFSFKNSNDTSPYSTAYFKNIDNLKASLTGLLNTIQQSDLSNAGDVETIKEQIQVSRNALKTADFWLRYLEPLAYKKINAPLPVEWETEVFEKFEKPYKREGAGLTLAYMYLDEEEHPGKETLMNLIQPSITAMEPYTADSITGELGSYHHFFLCNRLFLLNLAAIYTTGFECPDGSRVIPELRLMLSDVYHTSQAFNETYPATPLNAEYMELFKNALTFVKSQPSDYTQFDHFSFIRDYINPLYALNQKMILQYKVVSKSMVDYSLNKTATSIFDKNVYDGQNAKGIFYRVRDSAVLAKIDQLGKELFYDPMLSGNNMRSCASCHKPTEYFTDTARATAFQFDHKSFLPRNAPSLVNVQYNHLVMLDGKHISLQDQTKAVVANAIEMSMTEKEALKKVLSCKEYKNAFKELLKYTPTEPEISFEHIASAITLYYGKYSKWYSPFDEAMTQNKSLDPSVQRGFNLFMGKAQCATCHFVPQFNGVKPPYIGSEFEVIGVPEDTAFKKLSPDKGRYEVNPAGETLNAFRTTTVRNAEYTKPYMHNGVFTSLEQVIDFYDAGGGAGRGLNVPNQTLPSDSLRLTGGEKKDLIAFIKSLNENIVFDAAPEKLPASKIKALNRRKVGGEY